MNAPIKLLPLLLLATLGLGCSAQGAPGPIPDGRDTKVLFIGIDGLRGDGIPGAETPALDALTEIGLWTLFASTQVGAQTVSGPGWTSMLTGVDAEKHGIYANGGWTDINRDYPTLISRSHSLGLPTATAVNWLPIQENIIESEVSNEIVLGTDEEITVGMALLLEEEDFDVHFIALDDVDHAGHSYGFSPEEPDYVAAVETADERVGRLVSAIEGRPGRADENWLIVVTSDHGGLGTSHGGITAEYRAIPLIIAGDSVSPGELGGGGDVPGELDVGFVSHMDVHPTVMEHLGHPAEASWDLDGYSRGLN